MDDFDDLLETPEETQEEQETGSGLGEPLVNPESTLDVNPDTEETEEATPTAESKEETEETEVSDDPIIAFLQSKGVKDPSKIPFINEKGETEDVDFNTLTAEEKLEILNELSDPGLSDDEINTINYLRQNRMSLNEIINYFSNKAVEDYLNENPDKRHQKTYSIDEYTDDDLYLVDLHNRFPDFSDEELLAELNSAKENSETFSKKVEAIRTSYKKMEDEYNQEQQNREAQQAEDLRNNLLDVSRNFNEIQLDYTDDQSDSLVVEEADKQKIISYLMDTDSEGKSAFVRDLENPAALFELGWLRTQGADALANMSQYWKGQLAEARSINKKLQAKLDKYEKNHSSVVVPSEDNKKEPADYWDTAGLL